MDTRTHGRLSLSRTSARYSAAASAASATSGLLSAPWAAGPGVVGRVPGPGADPDAAGIESRGALVKYLSPDASLVSATGLSGEAGASLSMSRGLPAPRTPLPG